MILKETCGISKPGRERASRIYSGPEHLVGAMEGAVKRTCINVFIRAWCVGECTNLIDLRCVDPSVGVNCLPDGKQPIHIPVRVTFFGIPEERQIHWMGGGNKEKKMALRMMQPENGIESRIRDDAHMSSISHQTVDDIMHIFNAVVSTAPTVRVSRVGEWCIIGLFGNELVGKDAKAVCFAISNEKKRSFSMLDPFPRTLDHWLPIVCSPVQADCFQGRLGIVPYGGSWRAVCIL